MRQFWVIVFVLIIVSRAITMLIERANKKQQEQRMREAAPGRQRSEQRAPEQRSSQGLQTAQRRPQPGRDREQDLASRRKAQLEELRRRRQGRSAVGPAPSHRAPAPARAPAPPPLRRPGGASPKPASRPAAPASVRPAPVLRRDRPSPQPFPQPQARPQARPHVLPTPAPPFSAPAAPLPHKTASPAVAVTAHKRQEEQAYALSGAPRTARSLLFGESPGGVEAQAAALRRLVVLKEILDPPVALRSDPG